jgi:hypothetical protein
MLLSCEREECTCPATAMHLEANNPVEESWVVIIPNLEDLMKLARSSIFVLVPGSSMFFSLYLKCG